MMRDLVYLKRFFFFVLISFVMAGKSAGQEAVSALSAYRDACVAMVSAIDKHDKYSLYDVQKKMKGIELSSFATLVEADEATKKNAEKPNIMFTCEGVDTLIARNFELVELNDLSTLRGDAWAQVLTHHAAIAPGATLTWQSEAYDSCEMVIVWHPAATLTLTVTDLETGKTYEATTDSCGYAATVKWAMPSQTAKVPNFSFSVTNHSNRKVSFVVAMN